MILKGSQRGGSMQLAVHLMNERDNDHVTLHELRGFVSEDLAGALAEMHAISKATRCRQFMFSLSLNPPKDAACSIDELMEAVDLAGEQLGLADQPRAVVIHEKEGRRHAHVVWSRIDAATMTAIPMSFFRNRLTTLSKELYLRHGWELPEGHRENGWKNPLNFTLAEWQQAKRLGLDPREIKQLFQDAWRHSDGPRSFRAALEDRGYFLAQGDRRGFVAVDLHGEVYSVARMVGIKTRELEARLGSPEYLPPVEAMREAIRARASGRVAELVHGVRQDQREALRPLLEERRKIVEAQRRERARLREGQERRWKLETAERQARFRRGVRGLWDVLTGRAAAVRKENEEAMFAAWRRDAAQREAVFEAQMREREGLQQRMDELRRAQRQALMGMIRHVAGLVRGGQERVRQNPGRSLTPGF